MGVLARVVSEMSCGEALEFQYADNLDVTEAQYEELVAAKTGSLIGAATRDRRGPERQRAAHSRPRARASGASARWWAWRSRSSTTARLPRRSERHGQARGRRPRRGQGDAAAHRRAAPGVGAGPKRTASRRAAGSAAAAPSGRAHRADRACGGFERGARARASSSPTRPRAIAGARAGRRPRRALRTRAYYALGAPAMTPCAASRRARPEPGPLPQLARRRLRLALLKAAAAAARLEEGAGPRGARPARARRRLRLLLHLLGEHEIQVRRSPTPSRKVAGAGRAAVARRGTGGTALGVARLRGDRRARLPRRRHASTTCSTGCGATRGAWILVWKALTEGFAARADRRPGTRRGADRASSSSRSRAIPPMGTGRRTSRWCWRRSCASRRARSPSRWRRRFPREPERFDAIEIAGPGFLNFRYSRAFLQRLPPRRASGGRDSAATPTRAARAILVEYVSANPTGPLNVVNARAAAVGATLVRLLDATGHDAEGEFYVNDAGARWTCSANRSRACRGAVGRRALPRGRLSGRVRARRWRELLPRGRERAAAARDATRVAPRSASGRSSAMLEWQQRDLADYGAEFAPWFRESRAAPGAVVEATLAELSTIARRSSTEPKARAWLKLRTAFGDDKDRVVVRSNGEPDVPAAGHRLSPRQARARIPSRHRSLGTGSSRAHPPVQARAPGARARAGLPRGADRAAGESAVGRPAGEDEQARRRVHYAARSDGRGRPGLREVLLPHALDQRAPRLRPRSCQAAERREPRVLRPVRARAHLRDPALRRRARARAAAAPSARRGSTRPRSAALIRKLAAFPEVVRGAALAREPHRIPDVLHGDRGRVPPLLPRAAAWSTEDAARSRGAARAVRGRAAS